MDLVVSLTSLVIALAALIVAALAWRRPFPADPTAIPKFGDARTLAGLDEPEVMNRLFRFLRDNVGRKILLYAGLRNDQESHFVNDESLTGFEHDGLTYYLVVPKRPDNQHAFGIQRQHGVWLLRGYFANSGVVGVYQGNLVHRLTPLSDDEAVA